MALDLSRLPGIEMTTPAALLDNPTLLFYGPPGCGKSTLSASVLDVPELSPALAVDFEGSMAVAAESYPDLTVIRIPDWATAKRVLPEIVRQRGGGYRTIILDTVNGMQDQLKQQMLQNQETLRALELAKKAKQPYDQKEYARLSGMNMPAQTNNSLGESQITQADWGKIGDTMQGILDAFALLPCLTIFTAHTVVDNGKQVPFVGGNVSKIALSRVPFVTGYMEQQEDEEELRTKGYEGEVPVPAIWFKPARVNGIRIEAKTRSKGLGAGMLDPTMSKIWAKMQPVPVPSH